MRPEDRPAVARVHEGEFEMNNENAGVGDRGAVTRWRELRSQSSQTTRGLVSQVVHQLSGELADRFYSVMMADPEAGHLLDHQRVNERLRASMKRWITEVFDESVPVEDVVQRQHKAGEVHARLGVELEWVTRGARVLKRSITEALLAGELTRTGFSEAVTYVHEMIDMAISRMNAAYASDADRQARSDESYRLYFMIQNLRVERERQKARLLEWSQEILVRGYRVAAEGEGTMPTHVLSRSAFGLWLEHKASMLFEGAPEIEDMRLRVRDIESELLPRLAVAPGTLEIARSTMSEIALRVDEIKALLASVFDRYEATEESGDSGSMVLNRRYLPTVARREIAHASQGARGFGMLAIEVDDMGSVREVLGVENVGALEAQLADILVDCVRAGDFIFRVGEDRYLAVVVEADADGLMAVARGMHRRVQETRLRAPGATSVSISVRVGVAAHDGHPDYQRLVDRALDALRQAGLDGRPPCLLAT